MTSQYQIIVMNMSTRTMSFYAFQKQAAFTDSGGTLSVLSSSLASGPLATHDSSGAQLDFSFDAQTYVGATASILPTTTQMLAATIPLHTAAYATSEASAVQPINLTAANSGSTAGNCSVLTISPLGLSAPAYDSSVPVGGFGIQVPSFVPNSIPELYCGCATINQGGTITLSSYIRPLPNARVICAPVPSYYVKTGSYSAGQAIPYDTSQSANCDFTGGYTTITVKYNDDGSFTVTDS